MSDSEVDELRAQLRAARARAPEPALSLAEIKRALADHIRFELACGHEHTADHLAVIRDQLSSLPHMGGQGL